MTIPFLFASAGYPPTDPITDATVLAAAVVAALTLAWHAYRNSGPVRSVYGVVALAAVAAAAARADRFLPWAAWPGAACTVAAAAVIAVAFPRKVAVVDRGRAEDAARLALLEAAVGASSDGVMIAEADADAEAGLRVVYANPAFERITGYTVEEAAGLSPSVFCQPESSEYDAPPTPDPDEEAALAALASVRAALGGSDPVRLEVPSRRKDGKRVWSEWQVVPVAGPDGRLTHRVAVIRDMTDRRRLETQLRESQKLEAVGRLAGGIAHDFNNLLTVIRGNAELIATAAPGETPAAELVDDIRGAADRATGLVRQLLAFGRRQPARPVVLDLNEAVADMAGMLRRLLGERVAVATTLAPGPVRARIDRGQFEQVVMNLAVNAKDAMPRGGTLTIGTAADPFHGPVRHVRVSVTDTGVGIPADARDKIFEPFYTTKAVGQGTGLGLATVYGIVQQAGGRVAVESVVGAGTTFRVDLPWCDEPAQPPSSVHTPCPVARPAGGKGRPVLLVEDEDGVRKLARTALEVGGYVVHEAPSGEDALALLPTLSGIELLVTDLAMPGIDGRELALQVRALRPRVAVVFISGYHSDIARLDAIPAAVFLPKPFTPADLLRAAGKALARAALRAPAMV